MHQSCVLIALATAALAAAPTLARADDPSPIRDAYVALRDGGCDASTIGTPIVARVLRNVPYAMRGKAFKSAELTYLYERDGGWYTASDPGADVASADRLCVRALDAQEKALRKRVKIKPAIEAAITRDSESVVGLFQVDPTSYKKFSQADKTKDGVRTWTMFFAVGKVLVHTVACELPAAEAKAKAPDWSKLTCHTLAAG
ncbi:MAG: hypothetical protein IPL61_34655 [Myxococcales bacterium]|nr:hypothetical protein [Myxococcales bacterium]